MKEIKSIENSIKWYSENKILFEQLSKKVETIIQEILIDNKIPIHAIYSRAKEIDSYSKKIEDSKYTDPISQITDLSGIRIIAYVESDLDKISKIIEEHFEIDKENSIDKSQSLGTDKVGYRSIHFIGKLPNDRIKLPEYKKFGDLYFEIQIRTILQHSWAEIEHDKNYKFSGELPNYLKRRFKVLAGVL
jgi:putative GTP pyrophosphokinase